MTTPDVEGIAAFYRAVLGFEELRRHDDDEGLRSVWLAMGEAILMVERGPAGAGGWHLLALRIGPEEREIWRVRLVQAGAYTHDSAYTLYGKDPDGNPFGLSHFPEG